MPYNEIITQKFKINKEFKELRIKRIEEALNFESGTIEKPNIHVISKLSENKYSFFLKPGKESKREKNPKINDMFPNIGVIENNKKLRSETDKYSFDIIWEFLVNISLINEITFKKVCSLVYRVCYFIDHKKIDSKLRYEPDKDVIDYIEKIDYLLIEGFKDKFKRYSPIGLFEFFHFIDLLGWNEDVKYHTKGNKVDFETYGNNVGRINTILSVIGLPLKVNLFLKNIIENSKQIDKINVKLLLETMQKISKSRGVFVLTHKEFVSLLTPYLKD